MGPKGANKEELSREVLAESVNHQSSKQEKKLDFKSLHNIRKEQALS